MRDIAEDFRPGTWEFTPAVVAEFDQHVRQSVPFYDTIQETVAELSDWLAPDGARIADLGASTGETLRRIVDRHPERNLHLVAYDTSAEMLEACRAKVGRDVETHVEPIQNGLRHGVASLTLALFTLQFLSPANRALTLQMARNCATPDGAILVAEKVRATDSRWFEIGAEMSWDYKAERGIDSDAIRAKARALRGVLRPGTSADLQSELQHAGWTGVTCLFRWHQWCLFGAFAGGNS